MKIIFNFNTNGNERNIFGSVPIGNEFSQDFLLRCLLLSFPLPVCEIMFKFALCTFSSICFQFASISLRYCRNSLFRIDGQNGEAIPKPLARYSWHHLVCWHVLYALKGILVYSTCMYEALYNPNLN